MNHPHDVVRGTDPLAALRHATASRHERLDAGMPLSGEQAGIADYYQHLNLLREWLAPLEAWLATYDDGPQGEPTLPPVERLAVIEADLAACESASRTEIGFLPSQERRGYSNAATSFVFPAKAGTRFPQQTPALKPGQWPDNASPAYRWGVCYVIEGAQLGGAVLYQRLHERLAPHPLRYLLGEPEGPGPRWRAFMMALRANVCTEQEIADACAGASAAFDRILAIAFRVGTADALEK